MNISKAKIAFYLLTFQKSKIPTYLLSVGNNWVNTELANATKESIKSGLATGKVILDALKRYSWLCPAKWATAYIATVSVFEKVIAACEDLQITVDEIAGITDAYKVAYAEWMAD